MKQMHCSICKTNPCCCPNEIENKNRIENNPTNTNTFNPTITVNPVFNTSTLNGNGNKSVCRQFPGGTFTFFKGERITINDATTASPYPSTITVSGLTGTIAKVTVTLFNVSNTAPSDLDLLLVAPDGVTNTMLMSDVDGNVQFSDVTLTFDDNASSFLPAIGSLLVSGTFKPTNFFGIENLPAPAPPTSPSVGLSNFNGMNPNGTWSLFVNDDFQEGPQSGSILDWAITITTPDTKECTFTPL